MPKKFNTNKLWIPIWIDKWLFGSTRLEMQPDERAVWLDLLLLASKNEGYLRANETTPYPDSQLAGLLVIPVDLLQRTIKKCIQYDKIRQLDNGTYYVINWDKYQLSGRHKRRFSLSNNSLSLNKNKLNKSRVEKSRVKDDRESGHDVHNKGHEDRTFNTEIRDFFAYYNLKLKECNWIKRELSLTYQRKRLIESRLKENISIVDLKICVDNFIQDDWEERPKFIDPKYCIGIIRGIDMFDKWLNWKSKKDDKPKYLRYGSPEWKASEEKRKQKEKNETVDQ